jgi:hypothetical protein
MEYATSFALTVAQAVLEAAQPVYDRDFLTGRRPCILFIFSLIRIFSGLIDILYCDALCNEGIYVGAVEGVAEQDGSFFSESSSAARASALKEVDALFPTASSASVAASSLHMDFVRNTTAYLTARNLPMNSYSLNGIVQSVGEDGSGMNLMMQLLGREQHHVTGLYRRKIITDRTKSLFSAILSQAKAYNR